MKFTAAIVLALLGSIPAFGQDQASCKAFFQVVHADAGSPGLRTGMDNGEKRWWDSEGQKKYPGLCLDGSVTSGDKPRYLLIWSKSKSIGQASVPPNEVYGQTTSALQASAPKEWIYQPRWNITSVTIAYVLYDGRLDVPPVHFAAGDHAFVFPDHRKALETAVKFLTQEPVFSPKVY
ncbi:MAG TPA: hypothetical protein VEJ46_07365 [Candidatus Acidoferrum sp.]|nr:hypothetical protein [Candidatus Acidoferrum sp.]